jgi:hypothetical protein
MKNLSKFEDFVNEGSIKGNKGYREFQMDSISAGLRESNIYLNREVNGKMTVKISAYSGGSDGFKVQTPSKLEKLTQEIFAAYRTEDLEVVKRGEKAEMEREDLIQAMQAEIFDAAAKELETADRNIEKAIASILKKY